MNKFAIIVANEFVSENPLRLEDEDLPRIGSDIGVGEDELHAFLDVEAAGGGWDKRNRIKILREPHVGFRHATGEAKHRLMAAGLIYPVRGMQEYPKDPYPDFLRALAIDPRSTIMSTSWGIGQNLGENFHLCGYDSPEDMVVDYMERGEEAQLQGSVNFIKNTGLDNELRLHQWPAFARGYKGDDYADFGYDVKLAKSYDWWSKKPDTPWRRGASARELNITPNLDKVLPNEPATFTGSPEVSVARPRRPVVNINRPKAPIKIGWITKLGALMNSIFLR